MNDNIARKNTKLLKSVVELTQVAVTAMLATETAGLLGNPKTPADIRRNTELTTSVTENVMRTKYEV